MSEMQKFHWAEGMKYVTEGIKGIFLLNGAATIAILSFIGNADVKSPQLIYAMILYSFGALMGPLSFVGAYLTQLLYGNDDSVRAWRMHIVTYVLVFLGIGLFVAATLTAGCGMMIALDRP